MRQITLKLKRLLLNNTSFAYKYQSICDDDSIENDINEILKKYQTLCQEMWNDLQLIKKNINKKTENEMEILKHELRTAGNLKLRYFDNVDCDDYKMIESILKSKLSNYDHVDILSAIQIDHKFSKYAFNKYCRKIKQKQAMLKGTWGSHLAPRNNDFNRNNNNTKKGNSNNTNNGNDDNNNSNDKENVSEIEMNEIFVIDEFFDDDSTKILSWILTWNDFCKPIKVKPLTQITNDISNYQIVLFVKGFFNPRSKDWQNIIQLSPEMDGWIITDSFQLLPLYVVEICTKNKDNHNKNEKEEKYQECELKDDYKWNKLMKDIFDIGSVSIYNKKMPSLFGYLFNGFRSKWYNKLQKYLKYVTQMKINIDDETKLQQTKLNVDEKKIEIINCETELIVNTLKENEKNKEEFNLINISFNKCINNASQQIIKSFKNIEKLDLSFNSLRYIPNIFESMQQLNTVNLSGNHIVLLNELTYLKYCLKLKNLNIDNNPIIFERGFVNLCMSVIPSIQILNGVEMILNEENKSPTYDHQFINLFCNNSYKKGISSIFETNGNAHNILSEAIPSNFNEYKDKMIYLNLSSCKLLFIPPIISELINMEILDLSNNFILQIKNLQKNKNLKELMLNNNNLTSISGLSCLESNGGILNNNNLIKLEIGCNNICDLKPLSKYCYNLKYLTFECNKIKNISSLKNIKNLIQINASYNLIEKSNDIYLLSALSNIAILDLKGNKICETVSNYRFYTIFCIKSLRMLDGKSVTNSEIEESSNLYGGRLHFDFIVNKIGHEYFDEIRILNLSKCNINILDELTPLNPMKFKNIKELDLSDNNLSNNISIILQLKTLINLNLNNNKIEKINCLNSLKNLQRLELCHNKIETISLLNLYGLKYLKYLSLNNNKIIHIDGLYDLPDLQTLHLSSNKIRKISSNAFIEIAQSLNELNLKNNGLRQLDNLDVLENLKILNIEDNRINNVREFKILEKLRYLFQIMIKNNPISTSSSRYDTNKQYINSCYEAIIKYSCSIQFVGNVDLSELRRDIKIKLLNEKIQLASNSVYSRSDNNSDNNSDNVSSSSLLSLQNPIGLKIKTFRRRK